MRHVFIIGSKGIPARYGGFETFVEKLTEHRTSSDIKYHVACAVDALPREVDFEHNGAHCHCFEWRRIGPARAIAYDLEALDWAISYARVNSIKTPVFYVLACRIGPFIARRAREIHSLGGALFVNPDGHEYKRSKWSAPVRAYWKLSERGMVGAADLLVCDSREIERCVHEAYSDIDPVTVYVSYGADTSESVLSDDDDSFVSWLEKHGLEAGGYYLVVGRLVPENNFETMIREYMASMTNRSLVLITSENAKLLNTLERTTGFRKDPRVRFVGSVYDAELLKKIRENARAYIHGHEVGGTNPSLLEALASTKVNLLLDVEFNREVGQAGVLYWGKDRGSLAGLIKRVEEMQPEETNRFGILSSKIVGDWYSWPYITRQYETLFLF